ncbi:MAG: SpoIID/LytB domain-containing protein [Desulfotomaculaceae bacterium]|nr:SpoIID/LytB domain-containing protein [Desulfotomaculaceae bacterium]
MGNYLVILLFVTMIFFPVFVADAAVEAGTVRVLLARQSTPVNFKVSADYQLVNQTTGKFVTKIQKNENWQVRLENDQIQFQGPHDSYGPFTGPVAVVQGYDFRVKVMAGNKKAVERTGADGLTAIGAGGKIAPLAESSVLSARSIDGIKQLGASPGLSLVSLQTGSEDRRYRGNMEFCIEKESLAVINELNIEDYLRGVVPAEMLSFWPAEALKAQAVLARNYALQKFEITRGSSYHVTNDQQSQVYRGYDSETEATDRAVAETRGLVLVNRGEIISGLFHSSSGGFIENSEDVWLNALPYLEKKEDPFDKNDRHYNWQVSYTNEQLTNMFKTEQEPFVQITDIEVAERTAAGARAKKLVIRGIGPDGMPISREVKNAENVRAVLGLKSALFKMKKIYNKKDDIDDITEVKDERSEPKVDLNLDVADRNGVGNDLAGIEISGSGYGHGVGLSQWGAYGMAKQGYNYQDILKYYYKDVSLVSDYGR